MTTMTTMTTNEILDIERTRKKASEEIINMREKLGPTFSAMNEALQVHRVRHGLFRVLDLDLLIPDSEVKKLFGDSENITEILSYRARRLPEFIATKQKEIQKLQEEINEAKEILKQRGGLP